MNEVYEIDGEKYHYNGKNWVDCYNCVAPLAIQQKLKVMAKKDTVATRLKKPLKPINTVTLKVSPKQDTKNCIEHLKNLGYGYDYRTKVYFIHYYVPKKFRNEHAASRDSQRILELKDKYRSAIDYYAGQIETFISNYTTDTKKIALLAIPSSKTDKKSCIIRCIDVIFCGEHTKGNVDYKGNYRTLYYYAEFLKRTRNLKKASHQVNVVDRPSESDHINTIWCSDVEIKSLSDATIFLIDDVSTTGTIFNACTKILTDKGISPNNIVRLAMGKTT